MSASQPARHGSNHRRLPVQPSQEHLKKQAKRRAKADGVALAEAQHRLAQEYGSKNWAELMHVVEVMNRGAEHPSDTQEPIEPLPALLRAICERGDVAVVRRMLEMGVPADSPNEAGNTPLWLVCQSDADAARRIEVATLLLAAGASPRRECEDRSTPLHFAAWRGPVEMVELLIRHNAKTWQADNAGKLPIDYARGGVAPDREKIVHLLDRPVIDDPHFRAAVNAIHAGDLPALRRLLADHPNLSRDRAIEPDCYLATDYFGSPKLLWFVANNPTLMKTMPANLVDLAATVIDAGVESADPDYTLELVLTSDPAREQGFQKPLMRLLLDRGAKVTPQAVHATLGHGLREPVETLLAGGMAMTAAVAAGLGRVDELARLLPQADDAERHAALSMAVINRQLEAARQCLDAGADVNAFLLVHAHSTPLHQAAIHDDVDLLKLLVERGARLNIRDTLWHGTPLGWAIHENKPAAAAYLRSVGAE
jgi:peptide-methionine (S)-S-oxide reductase